MKVLSVSQVKELHRRIQAKSGGLDGIRDTARLESALAQPFSTYGGKDLYPDILGKAAALGFFLVRGHAFNDGNKRIGFASMKVFLLLNGYKFSVTAEDGERAILGVASGEVSHAQFEEWVRTTAKPAGA